MAKRKATPESVTAPVEAPAAEYTVLARRYRPQQFAELIGQEPVAQSLINALHSNRVAHAYLFTGARGVGKTSAARILAKALNCEKGPTATPCDQCDMCRSITSGEDMDAIEIDGASNNGVDQVRELRQNVQLRPSRGRYKIYIIDEVHMLSGAAFNALLKTLEEPPPHVKFIFATTEVSKIPITILSRCQRFDFASITTPRILEHLKRVVVGEKMQADDAALELVARRGAGSMRDAQSLLDQLLAFGGERLTAEMVHRLLGTANEDRVAALAAAVLAKDAPRALEQLGQASDHGLQLGELLDQLIDYWRDLMVVQCAGASANVLSVTGAHREALLKQATALQPDTVLAGLDVLVSAKNRLKFTSHGRVVMEMAVVRLCRLDDLTPLAQLAQWVSQEGAASARAATSTRSAAPSAEAEKKKVAADIPSVAGPLTAESVNDYWPQVLEQLGFVISNDLRRAEVAISGPNRLAIRFSPGYNPLDPDKLARITQAVTSVTGQVCAVSVEEGVANSETAAVSRPTGELSTVRARRQREEVAQVPLVSRAKELLGAQIVHMDDDFGAVASIPVEAATTELLETSEVEEV